MPNKYLSWLPMELHLPSLPSMSRLPSWVNQAGRVDRSACVEISAREVMPRIDPRDWQRRRTSSGRQAFALVTITSYFLQHLHDTRLPRQLVGDLRTPKSNAMKGPRDPQRRRHLKPGDTPWRHQTSPETPKHRNAETNGRRRRRPPTRDEPPLVTRPPGASFVTFLNPNKGATASKTLALRVANPHPTRSTGAWSQAIGVEHWRLKSKRPGGRPRSDKFNPPDPTQPFLVCPICGKKKRKLFMPLATKQEFTDAQIAEGWLRMLDALPNRNRLLVSNSELRTHHSELLSRYAPLLSANRILQCVKCLGIRYGGRPRPNAQVPKQYRDRKGAAKSWRNADMKVKSRASRVKLTPRRGSLREWSSPERQAAYRAGERRFWTGLAKINAARTSVRRMRSAKRKVRRVQSSMRRIGAVLAPRSDAPAD